MPHESAVVEYFHSVVIADQHAVGERLAHLGLYSQGHSSYVNAGKICKTLVSQKILEKVGKAYRLPSSKSEYSPHSEELTKAISALLKLPFQFKIHREKLTPIGLIPDAVGMMINGERGRCFVFECCLNETQNFLVKKINAWLGWKDSLNYLSKLFGYRVPCFDFVVKGLNHDKAIEFNRYLEEVQR